MHGNHLVKWQKLELRLCDLRKHSIIFRLRDLRDRFLQHHAHGVHNDVHLPMLVDSVLEEFLNRSAGGQVTLVDRDSQVFVRARQFIPRGMELENKALVQPLLRLNGNGTTSLETLPRYTRHLTIQQQTFQPR